MKSKGIQTVEQQIAALTKEDKRSHEILVEDFMKNLHLRRGSSEAIALGVVQGKRK